MTPLTPVGFLLKFWHWFAIAALVGVLLFMRGDLASMKAAKDKAETRAATLQAVNDTNAKVIAGFAAQRLANDEIIKALGVARQTNNDRETTVRVAIERERNVDPVVRDWLSQPVPSGVQRAINPPGD